MFNISEFWLELEADEARLELIDVDFESELFFFWFLRRSSLSSSCVLLNRDRQSLYFSLSSFRWACRSDVDVSFRDFRSLLSFVRVLTLDCSSYIYKQQKR